MIESKSDREWRAGRLVDSKANVGGWQNPNCLGTFLFFSSSSLENPFTCLLFLPCPLNATTSLPIYEGITNMQYNSWKSYSWPFEGGRVPLLALTHTPNRTKKHTDKQISAHMPTPKHSRPFHSFRWILCNFALRSQLFYLPSRPLRTNSFFCFSFLPHNVFSLEVHTFPLLIRRLLRTSNLILTQD